MLLLAISLLVAILLATSGAFETVLPTLGQYRLIGSFLAGMFYISAFTVAPAAVVLGELAQANGVVSVALFGAAGGVMGDYLIFHFVKDRLATGLQDLLRRRRKSWLTALEMFLPRWFLFTLGALIIASPLPDELGITLLGFSHIRTLFFLPLSFAANFIGILAIGLAAKSLIA